ncbi:MAG: hypothetical protein IJP96_03345 [Synergistaceae bacterium]|nr:hypothetical protein [Synergistaceae bacterium]
MPILRVFSAKTNATPEDEYVAIGSPGLFIPENISEIHISVAFTWHLEKAEKLAQEWSRYGNVKIGGPAFNIPGGEFTPGMYIKKGYVITSRGCPNHCWFCAVNKRESNGLHELEIKDGWNILDDNLLACSEKHIKDVFEMLKRQKHRPVFTGGLEAKILKEWHVQLLKEVKAERMFFAYDTPDDLEPLMHASKLFKEAHFGNVHNLMCYVLIGYPKDTFEAAEERLHTVLNLGFCPYAMLYRDEKGETDVEWRKFQRLWARPTIIFGNKREKVHDDRTINIF